MPPGIRTPAPEAQEVSRTPPPAQASEPEPEGPSPQVDAGPPAPEAPVAPPVQPVSVGDAVRPPQGPGFGQAQRTEVGREQLPATAAAAPSNARAADALPNVPGAKVERHGATYIRIRPALRSFVKHWAIAGAGVAFALSPALVFAAIFALIGLASGDSHNYMNDLNAGTRDAVYHWLSLGGFLGALWGAGHIVLKRMMNRFYISHETVAQEYGLIAKKRSQVNLAHIRTIDVGQSFWDRLLGVGRLYFSSAGTAGVDVVWHGIKNPSQAQAEIQQAVRNRAAQSREAMID